MLRNIFLLVLAVALFVSIGPQGFAQQSYTVTDLGTLGGTSSQAWAINNSGQIVGQSFTNNSGSSERHAFSYKNGVMQDLGTLGGPFSDAFGVNDAGQVVGRSEGSQGIESPFLFANNQMTNLGVLPNDWGAVAFSLNKAGATVGLSIHNGSTNPFVFIPIYRGFLYKGGVMQDLSLLFGGAPSRAEDINNSGQIVGSFNFDPFDCGQGRAFLYTGDKVMELGVLPGSACSAAIAINDAGEIVGINSAADGSAPRMFYYYQGVMHDLGSVGSEGAGPRSINNAGEIVGSFTPGAPFSYAAFIYSDGLLRDLNSLIPASSGWVLNVASGINDSGQIVGWGYRDGNVNTMRAFLLTPTVPLLLKQPGTSRALALNSVTQVREPFSITTPINFGSDQRTRIALFARGIVLAAGEDASVITVRAEDANHNSYSLPVEFVGNVENTGWPTQVVVRLPDELASGGDFEVSLSLRGVASNKVLIAILP